MLRKDFEDSFKESGARDLDTEGCETGAETAVTVDE